ncbi:hypothetical protein EV679_2543 [Kerstersia gyiorum]|uniref:Single-stranded DNA-binding protein n=1 Tax=Kerstersia gyiorum TaxID=206506 RepID=A0A4Q7ML63_9BURK|nr:hypothetical protein [Kerstersia gyiorum]KAB0541540.1 hypothetical protein F7P85_16805 [Kerstersia gyiorum]RZS67329.1 hypothetical protein EV679_2543 [Kerstersia gyiorum]
MKFNTRITIAGVKGSKGKLESGQEYDSTKIYVQTDLDDSKGMGKGFATVEYNYGTSEEFHKLKHLPFPLVAEAELEIVTNGKTQKTVITSLQPIELAKPTKAA